MSSKMTSQSLITDKFSQKKSGTDDFRPKEKGKKTPGRPIKSSVKRSEAVEERADDVIRRNDLDKLRQFDLDWRFGPCTGITRLERWERAESHGHHPPRDIKDLILDHRDDEEYVQNIWTGYPI